MDAAKEHQIVGALWARKSEIVSRVAWLSLDQGDNDPKRFLIYLIAALQTMVPQIGAGVLRYV